MALQKKEYEYDLFLSHASEDKEDFVRPLATQLVNDGVSVLYDEFTLNLGDSIRESIDLGLRSSYFALIVLSPAYFKKSWTNNELNGYFGFDSIKSRRIIPIWHNVKSEEVRRYSPILSDRKAAECAEGIETIVVKVKVRLGLDIPIQEDNTKELSVTNSVLSEPINWNSLTEFTKLRFGSLGIDNFWQTELLADLSDNPSIKKIEDIDIALVRSATFLAVYAKEEPDSFNTGTDYITKALGFSDLYFRAHHAFGGVSLDAFDRYASLIRDRQGGR